MPPDSQKQWPRRPPRLGRLFDTARPFYFVTFNTYKRHRFLARPEVHEAFCVFCSKAQEHEVAVGRYVIMPNHVHLFAAFPMDGITLAGWIQSLRAVIGKRLLGLGIHKPHWQEGFFDHLLRSYESYAQKWEYVHESCASATEQNSRRLAVPRRNCSDSICMRQAVVAASLCRGVDRVGLSTATERRGYN